MEGNEILVKWARERVLWTITKAEAFQRLTKVSCSPAGTRAASHRCSRRVRFAQKPEPQQNLDAMLFDLPSVPTSPKAGHYLTHVACFALLCNGGMMLPVDVGTDSHYQPSTLVLASATRPRRLY